MKRSALRVCEALLGLLAVACGGTGTERLCDELCTIREPSVAGAFDTCTASSVEPCRQSCQARIGGLGTLCKTCLVENATFSPPSQYFAMSTHCPGQGCGDRCDVEIGEGTNTCSYCEGDAATEEECLRRVYPRREVEYSVTFRPVSDCASVCQTQ
jgi:hypothetical protein